MAFYSYLNDFNITSASDFFEYKETTENILEERGVAGVVSICESFSRLNSTLFHMEECLDYDFVAEALGLQNQPGIINDYFLDLKKWRFACGSGYSSMLFYKMKNKLPFQSPKKVSIVSVLSTNLTIAKTITLLVGKLTSFNSF